MEAEAHTILQGTILTPTTLAVLSSIVGVGPAVADHLVPAAIEELHAARLVGVSGFGEITPTEAGVRATAPRFMKDVTV